MQELSRQAHVFIRPSASGSATGGVSTKTREVILIMEAAGYDTILVETVGVGQSEIAASQMVDVFVLLMLAGAGDELQGIKRGIMEMADIIAINKCDGDNIQRVRAASAEFTRALQLFPPHESGLPTSIETCSALTGAGIDNIWNRVLAYETHTKNTGYFSEKRKEQLKIWLQEILSEEVMNRIRSHPDFNHVLQTAEDAISKGNTLPLMMVRNLAGSLFR
jgi:LAO/AO transport system kinase